MSEKIKSRPLIPALVVLLFNLAVVATVILRAGGDPLALARLGTRYSQADPHGTEGYDGQFVYYIALDPNPASVAPHLDTPSYRYQRILLPLLGRSLCLAQASCLPWMLATLGLLAQALGTWAVAEILSAWGLSPWYALVYGLWAGFSLAVRLDLPEPLAYALVAGAILSRERGLTWQNWLFFGLALFAKEVTALFVAAQLIANLNDRRWRDSAGLAAACLPFVLFQGWLWIVFGQPGLSSGGAMATPFEVIPYMGLLRIGSVSLTYMMAMLLVFGPAIVLPSLWGIIQPVRFWLMGRRNVIGLGLLLNSLAIASLPFSTFRETGGLLRFGCGLVLGVLLFAGRYQFKRVLNYSPLWLVLNVFLIK